MNYSIAIDGPAGAGKSTIAKKIAIELGFIYVDTGAMYRAMALFFLQQGIKAEEVGKIAAACSKIHITLNYVEGEQQVILNNENVNGQIRSEEVGKMASAFAALMPVRTKLVELQRQLATKEDVVMDGRDIGTCVLPKANVKIYLTASSKERASRRWKELNEKGIPCNVEEIEKDIIARDEQDMNREFSPLKQAKDAVLIDSSHMGIDEVVLEIIKIYKKSI